MNIDARYCVEKEFCGYENARYVVRFCSEYIGNYVTKREALEAALDYEEQRQKEINNLWK